MIEKSSQENTVDPVIREGKFFAAIGYLFFLCFVPLFLKKGNRFAEFHGRQALVLFIFELSAAILKSIPVIGDVISSFAFVVLGIASLVGILRVLMNEYWEMPIVHDIAKKVTM